MVGKSWAAVCRSGASSSIQVLNLALHSCEKRLGREQRLSNFTSKPCATRHLHDLRMIARRWRGKMRSTLIISSTALSAAIAHCNLDWPDWPAPLCDLQGHRWQYPAGAVTVLNPTPDPNKNSLAPCSHARRRGRHWPHGDNLG